MNYIEPWMIIAVALTLVAAYLRTKKSFRTGRTTVYCKQPLLSPTELSFYKTLCRSTDKIIFTKVRLADIIKCEDFAWGPFNAISRKHIDFLLCEPETLKVIMAIELDDKTHEKEDRKAKDQFKDSALRDAQITILRIKASQNYSATELQTLIENRITKPPEKKQDNTYQSRPRFSPF